MPPTFSATNSTAAERAVILRVARRRLYFGGDLDPEAIARATNAMVAADFGLTYDEYMAFSDTEINALKWPPPNLQGPL